MPRWIPWCVGLFAICACGAATDSGSEGGAEDDAAPEVTRSVAEPDLVPIRPFITATLAPQPWPPSETARPLGLFDASPVPDFYQEPGTAAGRALSVDADGGEVIDPFSGSLEIRAVDARLVGAGLPIEVVRTYRPNRNPPGLVGTDYTGPRNAFGVGWDLHFGRVYQPKGRGCRPARTFADSNPVLELPDGTRKTFFLADADAVGALPYDYITQDRWVAKCISGTTDGLEVYAPDGVVYTFTTRGSVRLYPIFGTDPFDTWSLTSARDRNGNTLAYEYVTIGGLVLSSRVLASDGRQVTLTYTTLASGHALLASVATPSGTFTYAHTALYPSSGHFHLARATGPADAGSPTTEYSYYSGVAAPGWNPHALRSLRNPYGGTTTYAYAQVSLASDPIFLDSMVVAEKQRSDGAAWSYRYGLRLAGSDLDVTEILGPTNNEVFTHCGYKGLKYDPTCQLKDGLLLSKEIYERRPGGVVSAGTKTGTLVRRETSTWGAALVANQSEYRPTSNGLTLPGGAYERRALMTTIEQGGERFNLIRSNFDAWSNAELVTEYHGPVVLAYGDAPPNDTRTTRQALSTYWTSTTLPRWILHETRTESRIDQCNSILFPTLSSIPTTFQTHGYVAYGTGAAMIAPECRRRLDLSLPAEGIERSFDAAGNVAWSRTLGRDDKTIFTRNADGTVATSTDPLGRVTRYEDYVRGVPRREVREEGAVTTRVVDGAGNVTTETRPGPNGGAASPQWTFAYDGLNGVKRVVTPRGDVITNTSSFPAVGCGACRATRTLARGDFRRTETFDAFGRMVKTVLSSATAATASITSETDYDLFGRELAVWGPNARGIEGARYTYDALNRVTAITHVVGGTSETSATFAFERGGLEVVGTDERGKVTVTSYDAYGNPEGKLLAKVEQRGAGAALVTTETFHTRFGRTVETRQSGLSGTTTLSATRIFIPDERGRVVLTQEPESGLRGNVYDDAGNVVQTWLGLAPRVTMTYDRLDRRTKTDYPNATDDIETTYWPNGSIRRARTMRGTSPVVTTDYAYDLDGNLTLETTTHDGRTFRTAYGYDASDALASLTYPDGLVVDYAPDAFGRPTKVGAFASSVTYHPSGEVKDVVYANGRTLTMARNGRGQTSRVSVPGVMDLAYTYDATGNPTRIEDTVNAAETRAMGYDDLGRLTSATGAWGSSSFQYNPLGSMTKMIVGAETRTYNHSTSGRLGVRVSSITSTVSGSTTTLSSSYDLYGNAMTGMKANVVHDDAARLVQATLRSSPTTTAFYTYDAKGRRLARRTSVNAEPTFTVTNQSGRLVHQLAGGNRRDYVWLGAILIAQRDDDCILGRDADADGIPDCSEIQAQLDPNSASDALLDADGDGLDNRAELAAGTGIRRADSDGDGMTDGAEVRSGTNPLLADATLDPDGDGLTNAQEAAAGTRADRADTDGDGMSDKFEIDNGLNPLVATDRNLDKDGDGWSNYLEAVAGSKANDPAFRPVPGRIRFQSVIPSMDGDAPNGVVVAPNGNIIVETRNLVSAALRIRVEAYSAKGAKLWEYNPGSTTHASPIVGPDSAVYTVTTGASLPEIVAIGSAGALRWRRRVTLVTNTASLNSRPRPIAMGPDGKLYITSDEGGVRGLHVLDPATNALVRSTPLAVVPEGVVLAPDGTAYVGGEMVSAIGPSGTLLWQIPAPARGPKTDGSAVPPDETRVRVAARGPDGTLYLVHETLYAGDTKVFAYSSSGAFKWSADVAAEVDNVIVGPDGVVYVAAAGRLRAFTPAGASKYAITPCAAYPAASSTGNWGRAAPALSTDGTLWIGCSSAVVSLRASDGAPKHPAYFDYDTPGTATFANSAVAIGPTGDVYVVRGRARNFTSGLLVGIEGYPTAGPAASWSVADGNAQHHGRSQ